MNSAEWDSGYFQQLLAAGVAWLERHQSYVNAINVFPVPDGDTGTNLVLTSRAAERDTKEQTTSARDLLAAYARGALMGARGNGGVILCQILRGMAQAAEESDLQSINAAAFARMLKVGSDTGYKGVVRPVEGTILTTIRASADGAIRQAKATNDVGSVLDAAVQEAHRATTSSASSIPIFLDVGCVDAGAVSLNLILEGMLNAYNGIDTGALPPTQLDPAGWYKRLADLRALDREFLNLVSTEPTTGSLANLIYSNLISAASRLGLHITTLADREWLRTRILFWSSLLRRAYGTYPYTFLRYPDKTIIESEKRLRRRSRAYRTWAADEAQPGMLSAKSALPFVIIAVTASDGFSRLFDLLGARFQLPFHGLSVGSTLSALAASPSDNVLVLANGGSLEVLNQAKELHTRNSRRKISILETTDAIQGIIALVAADPTQTFEANMQLMTLAFGSAQVIRASYNNDKRAYQAKVNGVAYEMYFPSRAEAYLEAMKRCLSTEISHVDVYEDQIHDYLGLRKAIAGLAAEVDVNFFPDAVTDLVICLS